MIIDALRQFGGSAHKADVLKFLEDKLQGQLLPGDLEWRERTKEYVWQYNAGWLRTDMAREGILKSNSPRGLWELSEEYR